MDYAMKCLNLHNSTFTNVYSKYIMQFCLQGIIPVDGAKAFFYLYLNLRIPNYHKIIEA